MLTATCSPSTGYVSTLCVTHPAFHTPVQHLALTGVSSGWFIAVLLVAVVLVTFGLVGVIRGRRQKP